MHDFLTGQTISGNYDLPPHGVLVLDERAALKTDAQSPPQNEKVESVEALGDLENVP